ncbi:DNA primase [bacterium BMS3Abin03]|nr:DNA primase [bacterium BMS3Abin03]MCG6960286.1 DNA primase [bacterium BMS3Abin03]
MRIPESKIEEIRSTASIVDMISEYVQLRKRGKNYIGLCPFHNEKTPSFTVSDEKQIFHCFGCHTGGNIFKFLMEYKKISFVEAVQEVAEQLGIPLEYYESAGYEEQQSDQEMLYDINTEAAKYFLNNLLKDNEAEIARVYLQKRNIKQQTIRTFGLGYTLRGWENFVNYAKEKKIDLEKAVTLGLAGKHPDGRYYDRLPGRLIFPIFSPNGRVVAFAGRVLDPNEKGGKYINSPESIIYNKSRILYGLSFAKDEIRRLNKAIIVEGYMDLISLYQNGVKNVVAVSGTALTDEQVQLLSRYTKDVVLLFDADTAGIKASMRSIEILLKRDMEVKIVSLPQGEDPDSFVNKFGKDKFEDLLKKAENFIEFQTRYFEAQGMFNDSHTAAETIREVVKPLALINDELKRNLLIKNIARKFNLREKLLEAEFDKVIKRSSSQRSTEIRTTTKEKAESTLSEEITEQKKANPVIYNLEKDIIKLLFEGNSSILNFIHNNIKAEDFAIKIHMRLAKVVYEEIKHEKQIDADKLIEDIKNDELQSYVREIVFEKHSISSNWEERNPGVTPEQLLQKYTKDIVLSFKLHKIDKQIKENHNKIENTELEEDTLKLMSANRELAREKDRLREKFSEIEIE